MKHIFILTSIFLFFFVDSFAQNLVPNPSFEVYEECPWDVTTYPQKSLIPFWYLPNNGTSDYFNSCAKFLVNVPNNFIGNLWAFEGNAYTGIILKEFHPDDTTNRKAKNYREYLQAELKMPLIINQKYIVQMHYAVATYSTYAVNRLGIHFSNHKIKKRSSCRVLYYKPQIQLDIDSINIECEIWHELTDTLTAKGGEKFITIGNFFDDQSTNHYKLNIENLNKPLQDNINKNGLAYYYIDMIMVRKIDN